MAVLIWSSAELWDDMNGEEEEFGILLGLGVSAVTQQLCKLLSCFVPPELMAFVSKIQNRADDVKWILPHVHVCFWDGI